MKKNKVMTLSAILGLAFAAQAQEVEGDPIPGVEPVKVKKDKTFGNGTLPAVLAPFDVNEDGVLQQEEVDAMKAARKEARGKSADRKRPGRTTYSKVDTDEDGTVSDEEKAAFKAALVAKIAERRATRFAEVAGDNGELELEEFAALPPLKNATEERVASVFGRLDADESGSVTLDEFTARLRKYGSDNAGSKKPEVQNDDTDGDTVPDGEGLIDEINEGDTVEVEDAGRPDGSGNDVSATKPEDAGKPDPAGKSDDAGRPVDSGNDVSADKPGETGKPVEDEVVDPDSDDDTVDDGTTVEG